MKIYNYSSLQSRPQSVSNRKHNSGKTKQKRTYLGIFNNPLKIDFSSINSFYFQIIGISLITMGIIISFQTLWDIGTPDTSASTSTERDSVRVLTNFQTQNKRSATPKIEIIPLENKNIDDKNSENKSNQTKSIESKDKSNLNTQLYYVKSGDTVSSIATLLGLQEESIISLNKLTSPYNLVEGQKLEVPIL
jgi:LysM repeat protein